MKWKKLGQIYDGKSICQYDYAAVPIAHFIANEVVKIFFSARNKFNQSLPFYLNYSMVENRIIEISDKPILEIGEIGAFDDSGVMPSCIVKNKELYYLYYIGWNVGKSVPFRNSIGLAVSHDNCKSFEKMFSGPIIDRTKDEPHFVASNCVMIEHNVWKIWYLSCIKWEKSEKNITHFYHIKYATSNDGINWKREGKISIDFEYPNEYAISVPRVLKDGDKYKMWYSYRGSNISDKYRIGYAESDNGIDWTRKDEDVGLDVSQEGWDSEMICYPFVFDHNGKRYMLYNGNGYGKTGFGLAVLEDEN
jgi:hypothetical protein